VVLATVHRHCFFLGADSLYSIGRHGRGSGLVLLLLLLLLLLLMLTGGSVVVMSVVASSGTKVAWVTMGELATSTSAV